MLASKVNFSWNWCNGGFLCSMGPVW